MCYERITNVRYGSRALKLIYHYLIPTDACISLEELYFKKIQRAALQYVSAEVDQILEPITVSEDINMVPIEILRTLGCKCKSVRPNKRGNCAYKAFQLS